MAYDRNQALATAIRIARATGKVQVIWQMGEAELDYVPGLSWAVSEYPLAAGYAVGAWQSIRYVLPGGEVTKVS